MARVPIEGQEQDLPGPSPHRRRVEAREAAILAAAREQGASVGFLALRMAALSRSAGVSMGSLYRHFESREDVIVGVACDSRRARLEVLVDVAGSGFEPVERLIAAVIRDARFRIGQPDLAEAEALTASGALREVASARRLGEFAALGRRIAGGIEQLTRDVLAARAFLPWRDTEAQARTLSHAVGTLMAGATASADERPDRGLPPDFIDVCAATFTGLGWREPYPRDVVERVATAVPVA